MAHWQRRLLGRPTQGAVLATPLGLARRARAPPPTGKPAGARPRLAPLLGLFGGFEPGGFSIVILWTVVLGVVLHYMLFWTPLGNRLLAVGGDAMSARSRGVSVSRTKQAAFIAC